MMKQLMIVCLLAGAVGLAGAAQGLIEKRSAHSVDETLQRLKGVLEKKGIHVFAHVDHRKNAQGVDLELGQIQLLIFGNPRLGTPLMQSNPTIGIDLPMKILVWQDGQGQVWVAYNDPAYLAQRHGISDQGAVVKKMSGALNKITEAATQP